MRKYMEIAKITWKSMTAYRTDVFTGAAFSILRVLLAFLMWSIIFRSRGQVGGYDLNSMMTYYIITSLLVRLDQSNSLLWQFTGEIRDGRFGKYVTRPMKPMYYFIFACYGKSVYIFGMNFIATVIWTLVFGKYFAPPAGLSNVLMSVLIFMAGLNFMVLFNYFVSILGFRFINVSGLVILKQNLTDFLSGALIPLSVFPALFGKVFSVLPFYYTVYYPAALYLGRNQESPETALAVILVWNAAMLFVCTLLYKKYVRSFEGVGI